MSNSLGDQFLGWIRNQIPEPDVTIWMGDKTRQERGILVAKRVASIAIPLFGDAVFKAIGAGLTGFVSGVIGLGLGLCVAGLNIGKAWAVHKVVDLLIKDTSKYFVLKDEIKKVVDASLSVVIGIAYLVATVVLPYFGPMGIFSAGVNLSFSIATLVIVCHELHQKRKNPLVAAQMAQLPNVIGGHI
jgi:hypothetical protein